MGSRRCAWLYDDLPEAIRLCSLLLPPLLTTQLEHVLEQGGRHFDFLPWVYEVECPLVTSMSEHMPGIITFMVKGQSIEYASPNTVEGRLLVFQGAVTVRVVMAAALAGAFRQHGRREGLHSLSLPQNDDVYPCGPVILTWSSLWEYFDFHHCEAPLTLPKPFGWRHWRMESCSIEQCLSPDSRLPRIETLDGRRSPPLGLSLTDYHPSISGFDMTRERPIGSLIPPSSTSGKVEQSATQDRPSGSLPPDWQMCGGIYGSVAGRITAHPFVFKHGHAHCGLKLSHINAHVSRAGASLPSSLFYDGENLVIVKVRGLSFLASSKSLSGTGRAGDHIYILTVQ